MKVAIVHEMLVKLGGAEKVVESLLRLYPDADIFTLLYNEQEVGDVFPKEMIHPSVATLPSQKLYNLTKKQRLSLMLMPQSAKKIDLSGYDLVIISSSAFAHWVDTPSDTKTLVYYHAPARYLWDWTHEYVQEIGFQSGLRGWFLGKILSRLRLGDFEAGQKERVLLANSGTTKSRIQKYFRRDAQVLFPPIETKRFAKEIASNSEEKKYYIILSALTEFKKIDVALRNFSPTDNTELWIIGDGDYRDTLENIAPDTVKFLGAKYGDELVKLVQNSLGLIFPGEEDFGIVPIEVMAAGKPVFALCKGGLTETVIAGTTGEFFDDPQGTDFSEKFQVFHENNLSGKYREVACKSQAEKFDEQAFHTVIKKLTS